MIDIKRKLLYKCTGFCDSTSKPVLSDFSVRWNIDWMLNFADVYNEGSAFSRTRISNFDGFTGDGFNVWMLCF